MLSNILYATTKLTLRLVSGGALGKAVAKRIVKTPNVMPARKVGTFNRKVFPKIPTFNVPEKAKYVIEEHKTVSKKMKSHQDITLIRRNGDMIRWASSNPKWDKRGIRTWVLQPRHYELNPAVQEEGYGAGTTKVIDKGRAVIWTSNKHLHFMLENKPGVFAYVKKDAIVIKNPTKIPKTPKDHYKVITKEVLKDFLKDKTVLGSTKKDGARANWRLSRDNEGLHFAIGSYHEDKRGKHGENIDWTYKLIDRTQEIEKGLDGKQISKLLGKKNFIIEGTAEVWMKDFAQLNAKLQPNNVKAFYAPGKPYVYAFNITKVNNEDWSKVDPLLKVKLIKFIHETNPSTPFKQPETTLLSKSSLLKRIRNEQGVDGMVFKKGLDTYKYKWREEITAKIVAVQVEVGKDGNLKDTAIPVVRYKGRQFPVAGRMTVDMKKNLRKNPGRFIGKEADVSYTRLTNKGNPFQPILERIYEEGAH